MHPQLQSIKTELDGNSDWFSKLAERCSDEVWSTRPSAESWSASECVQHLNATSRAMVPRIREQLDASEGGQRIRRYRFNFMGWMIWRGSLPSGKSKFKTTEPFVPRGAKPKRMDLVAWAVCQSDVLTLLEDADGHPLTKLRVVSPFNSRISYNVYAAFRIISAHQQRHLAQAEAAIAAAAA